MISLLTSVHVLSILLSFSSASPRRTVLFTEESAHQVPQNNSHESTDSLVTLTAPTAADMDKTFVSVTPLPVNKQGAGNPQDYTQLYGTLLQPITQNPGYPHVYRVNNLIIIAKPQTQACIPQDLPTPPALLDRGVGLSDIVNEQNPNEPMKCTWAVVACCSPGTDAVRQSCFELLGCGGLGYDSRNVCVPQIMETASNAALNFYRNANNAATISTSTSRTANNASTTSTSTTSRTAVKRRSSG